MIVQSAYSKTMVIEVCSPQTNNSTFILVIGGSAFQRETHEAPEAFYAGVNGVLQMQKQALKPARFYRG